MKTIIRRTGVKSNDYICIRQLSQTSLTPYHNPICPSQIGCSSPYPGYSPSTKWVKKERSFHWFQWWSSWPHRDLIADFKGSEVLHRRPLPTLAGHSLSPEEFAHFCIINIGSGDYIWPQDCLTIGGFGHFYFPLKSSHFTAKIFHTLYRPCSFAVWLKYSFLPGPMEKPFRR